MIFERCSTVAVAVGSTRGDEQFVCDLLCVTIKWLVVRAAKNKIIFILCECGRVFPVGFRSKNQKKKIRI